MFKTYTRIFLSFLFIKMLSVQHLFLFFHVTKMLKNMFLFLFPCFCACDVCICMKSSPQNEALEAETSRLQHLMTLETGQSEEKAQGLEQRCVCSLTGDTSVS